MGNDYSSENGPYKSASPLLVGGVALGIVGLCVLGIVLGGLMWSGAMLSEAFWESPEVMVATAIPEQPAPAATLELSGDTSISDISGGYNVSGVNQDGSTYEGTAVIKSIGDGYFQITWAIGSDEFEGTGPLENGVFTVDDGTFVNTYVVLADGQLDGTWTQYGVEGSGTEMLTPIFSIDLPGDEVATVVPTTDAPQVGSPSEEGIAGDYFVSGTNQDGSTYGGRVTITNLGDNTYAIVWTIGDQIIEGVGTLQDGVFEVDDGEFVSTYTVLPDGRLDGIWRQYGVEGNGTETLTPIFSVDTPGD